MFRMCAPAQETSAVLPPFDGHSTIALVVFPKMGTKKCFHFWMLKDYYDEWSWSKQFTIGPIAGIEKPVGFWGRDQVLFEDSDEELVIYDTTTWIVKHFWPRGDDSDQPCSQAVMLEERLVSLRGEIKVMRNNMMSLVKA